MEKHYVCSKCARESDVPNNCKTEGCNRKGQPLVECNCTDGKHEMNLNDNV